MPTQFRPPIPHPAYEETQHIPRAVTRIEALQFKLPNTSIPEELFSDEQFHSGSRNGADSRTFNTSCVALDPSIFAQETIKHRRENNTSQSNQATRLYPDAYDRHKGLFKFRAGFVGPKTQAIIRTIGYILLYIVTVLSLVAAWTFPHPAVWQTSLFAVLSITLTLFSSPVSVKMLLFLMIAPWYKLWLTLHTNKQTYNASFQPLVSVLIPGWNEEIGLVPTIKTVLASTYRNVEIIVINDGSTDNSDTVIKQFLAKYATAMNSIPSAIPILYHYKKNEGKAVALNAGIALSHGDIIMCIDADCVLDKDCIGAFVEAMRDDNVMAVCGNVKVGNPGTMLSIIQLFEYAASFYARQADALLGTLYVISGAAGAYRRSVFDTVGTYGTNLRGGGEDVDLSIRVQQAGFRIAYAQDAIVYTEVPTTMHSLIKQRKRWTFSRFMTFKRYKSLIFSTKKEHNKVLTCVVIPLIIFNDWLYIIKMMLKISLYTAAVATGSFQVLAMLVLLSMILTAVPLFQDKSFRVYILLSPISWLLSFISTYIEMYASASAIRSMLSNREVVWGAQQRQGAITSIKKTSI